VTELSGAVISWPKSFENWCKDEKGNLSQLMFLKLCPILREKGTQLTQDKISNDKVEGQIQVDRKRLESMITGLFKISPLILKYRQKTFET
ncbi:hypothetical protein WUBG_18416, partial [Wuchereria bancrofti]